MPDIKKIDQNFENKETSDSLKYYAPKDGKIKVYGLNWFEKDFRFKRFPKETDELIKNLAEGLHYLVAQPSGGMLCFYSDASTLKIKVELEHMFNMAHMPFTSQGGCDLYIGKDFESLKFYRTSSFPVCAKNYEFTFFSDFKKEKRLFLINLPLYGALNSIEIGINEDASISPALNLFSKGKVVCYGTSITQGGCASRPGMSYTNSLSRRMNYEFLNFGFSGNGRGQKEVAKILASIDDVSMFILDYEANATLEMLQDTLVDFIKILRSKYPKVPILVMSKINMSVEAHLKEAKLKQQKSLNFQKEVVKAMQEYDPFIYFLDGHKLLGKYKDEATVDGCHPTDLGFMMICEYLEKYLKKILK